MEKRRVSLCQTSLRFAPRNGCKYIKSSVEVRDVRKSLVGLDLVPGPVQGAATEDETKSYDTLRSAHQIIRS